jgi:hypothetical protein
MTAYALRDGEDTILVDPLVGGEPEPLLAALDEIVRGRVRILVTTSRSTGSCAYGRGIARASVVAPRTSSASCRRWRRWRGLDVERVLVTDGEPVPRDGARALAASLARPPWRRSSLY